MKKEYYKFLKFFIIALFLEVIVFNITSYRVLFGKYNEKAFSNFEFSHYDEDKAFIKINNINEKVGTVKIEFNDVDYAEYRVYYSDRTTDRYVGLKEKTFIENYEKSKYIPVYLSGDTKGLMLSVPRYVYEEGKVGNIIINDKIPFDFNIVRVTIIFAILIFGYYFKNNEIFNISYSKKSLKQEYILLGVLLIFLILLTGINSYSSSEESLGKGIINSLSTDEGIYNKDFVNSIINRKLYLLDEPSEDVLKLENPYDNFTRDNTVTRDVDYKWDTALYKGHQYIYFGILPLLITFLPFYLLTHKYLKISIVVFTFSVFIFILLKEILIKILQKYFDNIPFRCVVLFLIILCSGSLILYANGIPRVYELVIIVGLYFVLQGIYFIIKSSESEDRKYLNIFLGCLCLALSVVCRPTDLIVSLLIVPYLLKLFIENVKNNKKNLVKLIVSVAIPYIVIGIALMWYNYIRFDSVFEFGAKYQLTIANMKDLGSRIFAIPVGIMCNLFNVPQFISSFPFIQNNNNLGTFYGYYYIENMLGGLFFVSPICFAIFYILKANRKSNNKELKIIMNSLAIVGFIIAILSVMMAGSNQRYLIDYAWMFILCGILIFSIIYNSLKSSEAKRIFSYVLCIMAIYTFLVSIAMGIVSEKSYMSKVSPEEYYKTKYVICFWE